MVAGLFGMGGILPMVLSRRDVVLGGLALVAAGATGNIAEAAAAKSFFAGTASDNNFVYRKTNFARIDKRWHRQIVKYFSSEPVGTIVVDTRNHFLYVIMENKTAIRYGVGVGKEGFSWKGTEKITQKREWPDWRPPAEMIAREKKKGKILPAHMKGGPQNPLGARALYLGSTLYRIHGTNAPWTIGQAVSSGCIRMRNEDVTDLYERVRVGTKVVVI
jgi:lipoprotein-anchoring transpeptidase ErfK/SrfK